MSPLATQRLQLVMLFVLCRPPFQKKGQEVTATGLYQSILDTDGVK